MDQAVLQSIWFWFLGAILTVYIVLDGYDFGVGFWYLFAKDNETKNLLLKSIAPFWDANEVWLITAGTLLFAAFPDVYASLFSALYIPVMALAFALIFRAVSIEYALFSETERWRKVWNWGFGAGSAAAALIFCVGAGNIIRGLPLNSKGDFTGGLFDLLNPYALLVGATGLTLIAAHGAAYLKGRLHAELAQNYEKMMTRCMYLFLVLFVITTVTSYVMLGSLRIGSMILAFTVFTAAVKAVVSPRHRRFATTAYCLAASMFAIGAQLYPTLLPSIGDSADSLTAADSSSALTLTWMLGIAVVGMAVVTAYQIFVRTKLEKSL